MANFRENDLLTTRVGTYKLTRELARRGTGVVYLAERADEVIRKEVVIRFIPSGEGNDSRDAFVDKVKALLALNHPSIARFLTGGTTEDGHYYLVREYVDGAPLDLYCNERGLSIDERLRLFQRVCAVVHYAHQNLVAHLALKPSDILVTPDGNPKVPDFGIATLLDSGQTRMTKTQPDSALDYASPERRMNAKITTASDVYSLGVILYELLTSHRPVTAGGSVVPPSSIVSGSLRRKTDNGKMEMRSDVIARIRGKTPRGLRKKLTGDLDRIALMAVRPEPERRYADASELARDLERHLTKFPVIARPNTWWYRAMKFIGRYPIRVSLGVLLIVTATNGFLLQRHMRFKTEEALAKGRECCKAIRQFTETTRAEIRNEISPLPGGEPVSNSLLQKLSEFDCGDQRSR